MASLSSLFSYISSQLLHTNTNTTLTIVPSITSNVRFSPICMAEKFNKKKLSMGLEKKAMEKKSVQFRDKRLSSELYRFRAQANYQKKIIPGGWFGFQTELKMAIQVELRTEESKSFTEEEVKEISMDSIILSG